MRTDGQQGILLNVVGIIGTFLGELLLARGDQRRTADRDDFLVSLIGAVVLLGIVYFVKRGRAR